MYKDIFSIYRSVHVSALKKKDKEEMSVIKRFCSNSSLASMNKLSKQYKIVVFLKGFTSFLLRRSFLDETAPKGNETKLAKGKWFNERRDTIHLPAQCQPLSLGKNTMKKRMVSLPLRVHCHHYHFQVVQLASLLSSNVLPKLRREIITPLYDLFTVHTMRKH